MLSQFFRSKLQYAIVILLVTPISCATSYSEKETNLISTPWLGVRINNAVRPPGMKGPTGIVITKVFQNSPANRAGVKERDLILYVGDNPINHSTDFMRYITTQYKPNDNIKLGIWRNGKEIRLEATLAERHKPGTPKKVDNDEKSLPAPRVHSKETVTSSKNSETADQKNNLTLSINQSGRFFALIIGNADYRYLPDLVTTIQDAMAIRQILTSEYGFIVRILTNASRRDTMDALDQLRRELKTNDNLLIYYAGHGYFDEQADRGYWLPVESQTNASADWISNADITDKLKAYRAKHVMVVADSCYSGSLTRGVNTLLKEPGYLERIAKKRARTVLTSGGNEPVMDGGGKGHSVFANALIKALRENTGVMDGTTLFSKIRRPIMLNSHQTPQYSDIRFAGHDGGDFLFIRKR